MTEPPNRSSANNRSVHRRRKSAVWKSSLLATGLGAVALGWALFSWGDTGRAAAAQDGQPSTDSTREAQLSQPQGWGVDESGNVYQFDYRVQDDSGFWVSPSPPQGRRSIQRWGGSGITSQPQFLGPIARTRGS